MTERNARLVKKSIPDLIARDAYTFVLSAEENIVQMGPAHLARDNILRAIWVEQFPDMANFLDPARITGAFFREVWRSDG